MKHLFLYAAVFTALAIPCRPAHAQIDRRTLKPAMESINLYLSQKAAVNQTVDIDTFFITKRSIKVHLNGAISDYPLRDSDLRFMENVLRSTLPARCSGLEIEFLYKGKPVDRLVSGYYSGQKPGKYTNNSTPWIEKTSRPVNITEGLDGRNIALWSSHGYYYSHDAGRWEWQRAPFFTTVEDMLTHSYITGFLAPMLENAGANVLIPRERDSQKVELIVDNGSPFYTERNNSGNPHYDWKDSSEPGFGEKSSSFLTDGNPFITGSARISASDSKSIQTASYLPFFPATGDYAVYVSYQSLPESTSAAYTVRHSGGEDIFEVNQSIGGGTWVYLGTFRFTEGECGQGVIVRSAQKNKTGVITTDAVRFGGGMGNIVRGHETSGYPRYAEAARYWLQWSGYPEEVYSPNDGANDYKDDYMSRGEWVNYMKDNMNIPVDMALALHTDAGFCMKDSIIGTLAIYKEVSEGKVCYSDGRARITARELADIVQSSIVDDIRAYCRKDWTRRAIWDRSYVEARVPDVPTVLIELLSHQNLPDMRLALDPEFKFIVSRAIYKGILRYLSYTSGKPYTVQPLPVKDLSAVITDRTGSGARVRLSWTPSTDPREMSAVPENYIVYRRVIDPYGDNPVPGFDNGTVVKDTVFSDKIEAGRLYSYKVVAVNSGGLSFPSEILSVGHLPEKDEILVVNGFTRVAAPGLDFGGEHTVPYIKDISYIGEQYEYSPDEEWIHNDRPGFGASYMDYGPETVAGNTFDYPMVHGLSLMRSGHGFCSASLGALVSGKLEQHRYPAMDIIFGRETACFANDTLLSILKSYCLNGGSLIVSGENIGKSTEYDFSKIYPETSILSSTAHSIDSVISVLTRLRDSIVIAPGHDSMLTTGIHETIQSLTSISDSMPGLCSDMNKSAQKADTKYKASCFAKDIMGYKWSNGHASSTGNVLPVWNQSGIYKDSTAVLKFQTRPSPDTYCVESPDAIIPSNEDACTFLRYKAVNTSAAVAYEGENHRCVSIGFPIETLTSQQQADDLMREVVRFIFKE